MNGYPREFLITAHDDIYKPDQAEKRLGTSYDPELLYVECRSCGRPVVWEPGKTTLLLQQAEVSLQSLDSSCLLLADNCPTCRPDLLAVKLQVVRLSVALDEDLENLEILQGNA